MRTGSLPNASGRAERARVLGSRRRGDACAWWCLYRLLGGTLGDQRTANGFYLAAGSVDIVAGLLAIAVIPTLTARHERRAVKLSSAETS